MIYAGYLISAYTDSVLGARDVDAVIVGGCEVSTVKLLNNGVSEDISEITFRNDGDVTITEPKPVKIERPIPLIPDDLGSRSIRSANTYIRTHGDCASAHVASVRFRSSLVQGFGAGGGRCALRLRGCCRSVRGTGTASYKQ